MCDRKVKGGQVTSACMRFTRGKKVCSNLLRLKVKDADAAVLGSVRHHLHDREVIERAMRSSVDTQNRP
jgi:hypothetical protein